MGHDVIVDKYARLYEQPFNLALLNHDVLGLCLSYYPCIPITETHKNSELSIRWIGLTPGKLRQKLMLQVTEALRIASTFKPDLIVGASDAAHIILANWLSTKLKCKFACDLYDDFESFGLSKIPFIKRFYRKALSNANVISCVSDTLSEHISAITSSRVNVFPLPSTIDKNLFVPHPKEASRKVFQLPADATIIGTAGGLTEAKGIRTVYDGFMKLTKKRNDIHLALAGTLDPTCPPPQHPNVHYLGKIPHADVPKFFSALDAGVIYINDDSYGRYSFPQKAFELEACEVPIIAAKVGDISKLYAKNPDMLYTPNDPDSFAKSTEFQIVNKKVIKNEILDWREQAEVLNKAYLELF